MGYSKFREVSQKYSDHGGRLSVLAVVGADGEWHQRRHSSTMYEPAGELTAMSGIWGSESRSYNAMKQMTYLNSGNAGQTEIHQFWETLGETWGRNLEARMFLGGWFSCASTPVTCPVSSRLATSGSQLRVR
jgi:hypothetical protein